MRLFELEQPGIGDIVEFELDEETVVEGRIVDETEDGFVFEFSETGLNVLTESCKHGRYYCSTDKKWKCRQGPKQTREGVAEGFFGIDDKIKGKIQNITMDLSDIPGYWNHERQTFTPEGLAKLKDVLKKSEYIQYALNLTADDYEAESVAEAHPNSKIYDKCWDGYKKVPGKKRGQAGGCVKEDELNEADYNGRKVKLNKPSQGDVKKFKVYVRNPSTGRIIKVNFGDPNMRIKKSNPARRRSFRARHKCDTAKDKTSARYWSCRAW